MRASGSTLNPKAILVSLPTSWHKNRYTYGFTDVSKTPNRFTCALIKPKGNNTHSVKAIKTIGRASSSDCSARMTSLRNDACLRFSKTCTKIEMYNSVTITPVPIEYTELITRYVSDRLIWPLVASYSSGMTYADYRNWDYVAKKGSICLLRTIQWIWWETRWRNNDSKSWIQCVTWN